MGFLAQMHGIVVDSAPAGELQQYIPNMAGGKKEEFHNWQRRMKKVKAFWDEAQAVKLQDGA